MNVQAGSRNLVIPLNNRMYFTGHLPSVYVNPDTKQIEIHWVRGGRGQAEIVNTEIGFGVRQALDDSGKYVTFKARDGRTLYAHIDHIANPGSFMRSNQIVFKNGAVAEIANSYQEARNQTGLRSVIKNLVPKKVRLFARRVSGYGFKR